MKTFWPASIRRYSAFMDQLAPSIVSMPPPTVQPIAVSDDANTVVLVPPAASKLFLTFTSAPPPVA
jgi:hypothetical protein